MAAVMLECAVRSDVGLVRGNNEDAVFASRRLAAVADGVGGRAAGEVASQAAIGALHSLEKRWLQAPLETELTTAVLEANATIGFIAGCRPETAGMSTTLTAVAVGDGYVIANIGDSRTYLYRDGALTQLTRDDSYVQMLLDSGRVDPEVARRHPQRSMVTEVLDGDPARRPALLTRPALPGDRLLLCSDGLSDLVDEAALRDALAIPSRDDCADRLVALALAGGGRDNVSVVVADVVPDDGSTAWEMPGD